MNTTPATYTSKPVQLRMKPELHKWVQEEAQRLDRSANWTINRVLEDAYTRAQQATQQGAAQ